MQEVKLEIKKGEVFDEVVKITSYIGGKNVDGGGRTVFDKVFVTDVDKAMLEEYFVDATNNLSYLFGRFVTKEYSTKVDSDETWTVCLGLSNLFNTELVGGLRETVFNFVVNKVASDWCALTDKGVAEEYADKAKAMLMRANNLIYHKRRPTRNF